MSLLIRKYHHSKATENRKKSQRRPLGPNQKLVKNEVAVSGYDTRMKLNPPLRCEEDREAIVDGLSDGTIDAVASDHIPVNPATVKKNMYEIANNIGPSNLRAPLTSESVQFTILMVAGKEIIIVMVLYIVRLR